MSVVFCLLLVSALAAPQYGCKYNLKIRKINLHYIIFNVRILVLPSGTGAGFGGGQAGHGGVSAFGAGISSGQNGGFGMSSGQGSAFASPYGFGAQGTGQGFGFGK